MAIYTKITVAGKTIEDCEKIKVNKSSSDNNMSSSFDATLNNYAGINAGSYSVGNEVIIYADADINPPTTIIFNGILENVQYPGKGLKENIRLSGRDYTARLMDRIVEPEVFSNLACGSIVKFLINRYCDDITTTNVIESTTSPSKIGFSNINVFDAIKKLQEYEEFNYIFYVDNDKDVHYQPASTSSSGYTLDNTNILKSDIKENRDTLFNEFWVYGDKYRDGYLESFTGDDSTDEFTLSYKPHDTQVIVDDVIQKGGVAEMNMVPISGTDYLVSYDNKQITFQSGTDLGYNSIPGTGLIIDISYNRDLPVIKYGIQQDSINQYGKRTKVIVDKNIKDPLTAELKLEKELNENVYPKKEGNIDVKGLFDITPSQTVVVNMPFQDVTNKTYDVLQVSYDFNKSNNFSERVQRIKVNKRIGDVTDRIKDIDERLRRLEGVDSLEPDILPRFIWNTGSFGVRTSEYKVYTKNLGSSFILGHVGTQSNPQAGGVLGSIIVSGINFLGDSRGDFQVSWSGGYI